MESSTRNRFDAPNTSYHFTETEFQVLHYSWFCNSRQWKAVIEWLKFHNIDPQMVPAFSEIVRDPTAHTITYESVVLDERGRVCFDRETMTVETITMIEQGEAGPLPWPSEFGA